MYSPGQLSSLYNLGSVANARNIPSQNALHQYAAAGRYGLNVNLENLLPDSYCYLSPRIEDGKVGLQGNDQHEKRMDREKSPAYGLNAESNINLLAKHNLANQSVKPLIVPMQDLPKDIAHFLSQQQLPFQPGPASSEIYNKSLTPNNNLSPTPNHLSPTFPQSSMIAASPATTPSPPLASSAPDFTPSRGEPPPYNSQHQLLAGGGEMELQENNISIRHETEHKAMENYQQFPHQPQPHQASLPPRPTSPPPAMAHPNCKPHPPNALCRNCQSVRRSHRQTAAALVRRAHSCQHQNPNRKSAPLNGEATIDDAPSILERLKKEWELSNAKKDKAAGVDDAGNVVAAKSEGILEDKQDKQEISDEVPKKSVSHLDRALNRLSMKRSSQQVQQKSPTKSLNPSGELLTESANVLEDSKNRAESSSLNNVLLIQEESDMKQS